MKRTLVTMALTAAMIVTTLSNGTNITAKAEEVENINTEFQGVDLLDDSLATDIKQANIGCKDDEQFAISEFGISTLSEIGHNSADTALFLDSSYMGNVVQDAADTYDNWYYFYADNGQKISALLEQPGDGNGDYDLYLYEYKDGYISPVAYSVNSGSDIENLSYISNGGYYFLRTVPITAGNSTLYFLINLLNTYDMNEPDDNINQSKSYESYLNVKGTIDNVFDQDWICFSTDNSGYYKVELNNVAEGCQYALYLYDSNGTYIAGMLSEGNNMQYVSLESGTYYLRVCSYNNVYNNTQQYNLLLNPVHSTASAFHYTNGGKLVEITNSAVYINGKEADLNWEFNYNINYTRYQKITVTDKTTILANDYANGSFVDAQNINLSDDCIRIKINNFNYFYFYYDSGEEESYNKTYTDYHYVYLDADTGKAVGSDVDIYLTWSGFSYQFNSY